MSYLSLCDFSVASIASVNKWERCSTAPTNTSGSLGRSVELLRSSLHNSSRALLSFSERGQKFFQTKII